MATELEQTITLAGQLSDLSVQNINQHAQEGLDYGHSKLYGRIEAFENFYDPIAHPEITSTDIYKRLYGQYKIIRRTFAVSYILKALGKHTERAIKLEDSASKMLEELYTKDYPNFLLSGSEGGDSASSIATVSSSPQSFPANPNASRIIPYTMKRGVINDSLI